MDKAVKLLCQAIGINTVATKATASAAAGVEIMLDGALLSALVQAVKGKKLLARSIGYLSPAQRWAIIPAILAKLLQIDPETQSSEDSFVEIRLLKLVTDFIAHAQQYQREQHGAAMQAGQPFAAFSVELLEHLRKCLKVLMVSLIQKSQLKKALQSRRERAEAVNLIVEVSEPSLDYM